MHLSLRNVPIWFPNTTANFLLRGRDRVMSEIAATGSQLENSYEKLSRKCVIGLYATAAMWGSLQLIVPDSSLLYFAAALLLAVCATGWAITDAKARGLEIVPVLKMLYFIAWPIGAVIYLIYRSKTKGLVISLIHAAGLYATLAAAFYITFYGMHFAGVLDPRF